MRSKDWGPAVRDIFEQADGATVEGSPLYSEAAERALLGCCMDDEKGPQFIEDGQSRIISPEAFYDLRHRAVWQAILDLSEKKRRPNAVTIFEKTRSGQGALTAAELSAMASDAAPIPEAFVGYVETVVSCWRLRRAIGICRETIENCRSSARELVAVDSVLGEFEQKVLGVGEEKGQCRFKTGRDLGNLASEQLEQYRPGRILMKGVSTGFSYLDKLTLGWAPGTFYVLGARPSTGKTAFAMQVLWHAADQDCPVGLFSVEMASAAVGLRYAFQIAGADANRFRTGFLLSRDVPRLREAVEHLKKANIVVDDTPDLTFSQLRTRARRMVRQEGVKLIAVDYMQLLASDRDFANREREVASWSKGFKALARELEVPVVVLAQLNRDLEKEKRPRKPLPSDLRDSGQIEQDADVIMLMYRTILTAEEKEAREDLMPRMREQLLAERYGSDEGRDSFKSPNPSGDWSFEIADISISIAKQREGPIGDFRLAYESSACRFHCWHELINKLERSASRRQRELPSDEELEYDER